MSRKAFALGVVFALTGSVPATIWALGATGRAIGDASVAGAHSSKGATSNTKVVSNGSTTKTKIVSNTTEVCVPGELFWTTVLSASIKKTRSGPVVVTLAAEVFNDQDENTQARVLLNGTPMSPGEVEWLESSQENFCGGGGGCSAGSFTWHRDAVPAGKKKVSAQIQSSFGSTCAATRVFTVSYT